MRRLAPALILLALASPAVAHASTRQSRIFEDDRMLLYSGPIVRNAVLDEAKSVGAKVIRAQFVWRNIALSKPANPSDPDSYGNNAWSNWDSLALEAHKRGMRLLATVMGPAPSWAAGSNGKYYPGSRYPSARAFGEFVTAVGRRYSGHATAAAAARSAGLTQCTPVPPLITCSPDGSPVVGPPPPSQTPPPPEPTPPPPGGGDQSAPPPPGSGTPTPPPPPNTILPRIDLWSIYNEPNHPLFVSPQRKRGVLTSPSIYRSLYRAGWRALSATGHGHDTILMGEVLPIGSNADRANSTTSPLSFARELFCLNGSGKRHPGCKGHFSPLHASGWALHDYYRKTGPFSQPPGRDDVTPVTLGKLHGLLATAKRRGRLRGPNAIWDTENGSQTRPPDPKGASLARQARYINEAEYLEWRTPYVRSFSQYLLQDERPVWAYQSGLTFSNGKVKPSLKAYTLAIYVKKTGGGVTVWGHLPAGGNRTVTIHRSRGTSVKVHVRSATGYFTKNLRGRAAKYRLSYGRKASRTATPR